MSFQFPLDHVLPWPQQELLKAPPKKIKSCRNGLGKVREGEFSKLKIRI